MDLIFNKIVKEQKHVRSNNDRRIFIDNTIVSYTGSDGLEYRKSFKCKPGFTLNIPLITTHEEAEQMKYQHLNTL